MTRWPAWRKLWAGEKILLWTYVWKPEVLVYPVAMADAQVSNGRWAQKKDCSPVFGFCPPPPFSCTAAPALPQSCPSEVRSERWVKALPPHSPRSTLNGSLQSCPFEAPPSLQMRTESRSLMPRRAMHDLMRPMPVKLSSGSHRCRALRDHAAPRPPA